MQMDLFKDKAGQLDQNEAPAGYYAVLKSEVDNSENICRSCDWRKDCEGTTYRCMPNELENGLKRNDGCSVVFKKRHASVCQDNYKNARLINGCK